MKLLLISPRGAERYFQGGDFETIDTTLNRELCFLMEEMEWMPNLGLLAIASKLGPEIKIEYLDEEYLTPRELKIFLNRDYDLVAVSLINAQSKRAYQLAEHFRKRGIPVAMGGIHPTACPEEVKQHCDFVFLGESEETFPAFIKDFEVRKTKPFYRPEQEVDLTRLPPPRFDLMAPYLKAYNRFPVQATRGCPRNCDFCFLPKLYGKKHRHKKPQQLVKEIEIIKSLKADPFISFTDENLLVDLNYGKALLRALIPLNIVWEGYCDISIAKDDELLKLLYRSNCATLLIGLESLRAENLKPFNPWKAKQVEGYRQAIKKIQSFGIGVTGLFIVGFEQDDLESFKEIRDFARESGLFDIEVSALCPFPATRLWERLEKEGRILTRNWERYTWVYVNFKPRNLSPEQLIEGLFWLFNQLSDRETLKQRRKHFQQVYRRHYAKMGVNPEKIQHIPGLPV